MIRIVSALVLVVVLLMPTVLGPPYVFYAYASIIIPWCMFELYRICLSKQGRIMGYIGMLVSFPFLWLMYQAQLNHAFEILCLAALLIILAGLYLFDKEKINAKEMALALSGLIYPMALMSFWVTVRNSPDGRFLLLYGMACTFMSDGGAYYTGKNFGKHKLSVRLSPKKTYEGLWGGMAASIIGGIALTLIYPHFEALTNIYPLWKIALMSALISLLDLCGDLTASMFKREYNVKDMGNVIPGHGGILDRMDGIVHVGAALYFIFLVLG